jgi:hypothetical protein
MIIAIAIGSCSNTPIEIGIEFQWRTEILREHMRPQAADV